MMGNLIRREELLTSQFVHTECYLQANKDRHYDVYKKGWNDALQAAYDNAPTVDAVEVVRCRDCKYRPIDYGDEHDLCFPKEYHCPCQCDDNWYSWMPKDDFFCARGERKPNAKGCEKNGYEYTDER